MSIVGNIKETIRRNPAVAAVVTAMLLALVGWLAFGFFGVQTLFTDETVAEADPFADDGATPETTAPPGGEDVEVPPSDGQDAEVSPSDGQDAEVSTLGTGSFIDRDHPTSGTATIQTDGSRTFLRLEDFETDNGPDLNVYLGTGSPDGEPEDFVDLGNLKGNIGDQNYELASDIDVEKYSTVYVWCVRFGVAFGAAGLE